MAQAGAAEAAGLYSRGLALARESANPWGMAAALTVLGRLALSERRDATAARLAFPAGLTAHEVDVLRLVAQGLTDKQVAEQLVVSPRTVTSHLTSIYGKLEVNTRAAATRFAVEHKLT